jgi:hypothetical protein
VIKVSAPFRLKSVVKDESTVPVVVKSLPQDLIVRLENGVVHAKEWFALESTDGSYKKTGQFDSDEIHFTGLDPALSYTLVAGGKALFEKVPYAELAELKGTPPVKHEAGKGDFRVRLDIDPGEAHGKFVLRGEAGYRQVKTAKDDQVPGDHAIDLIFTDIPRDESLTLDIDGHVVFAGVPYTELAHLSGDQAEPDLREHEMIDEHPTGRSES